MLNFLHDPIPITLSNMFTLVTDKKRRYHVTDDEHSIVLKAYEELNGDWQKMVEYMKDNVTRIPGDYMKKFKTNEYYQGASEKAAKKRLRRIVTKNVKKVATGTPVNPPLPQATSPSTVTSSSTANSASTATSPGTATSSGTATSLVPPRPALPLCPVLPLVWYYHPLFHLRGPCRTSIAYHCNGNPD